MYLDDKLLRHELNRIHQATNVDEYNYIQFKAKLEVMMDLDLITYDQYVASMEIVERQRGLRVKR